jgi:hypothetical protein
MNNTVLAAVALLFSTAHFAPAQPPVSTPRLVETEDELLSFTYGWPAEAAAIGKLRAELEADLARQRDKAEGYAREDKAERSEANPFNGHYFAKVWSVAGQSPRLLSLAAQSEFYSGGAHGNSLFHTILWDRTQDKGIHVSDIFADEAATMELMTPLYCALLNKERETKRGEPVEASPDKYDMNGCPDFDDQEMALVDEDEDGRFDLMRVLLPPYKAGPYAEGSYEVDIPFTPELRRLVKIEYRESF